MLRNNITNRKGVGDIDSTVELFNKLKDVPKGSLEYVAIKQKLYNAAFDLPNLTHPDSPIGDETKFKLVSLHGTKSEFNFPPKSIRELSKINGHILHTENVAPMCGPRAYHLTGQLAQLEAALVNYSLDYLIGKNFNLVSVPDIVPTMDVESCGFQTSGQRNKVYKISDDLCLAGTGEMSLASFLKNKTFNYSELPIRLATVSRCYRAETSDIERERGLYRVHQFTKVEMFGVTTSESSDELLEEFVQHQVNIFSGLGLHFRIIDMPTQELGASAYRKFDIETWLPAKNFWGEISSASNCTDYQSRRLNIKYTTYDDDEDEVVGHHHHHQQQQHQQQETPKTQQKTKYCHTTNGTACAVPRLIVALMESFQQKDGSVDLPKVLQNYMLTTRVSSEKRSKSAKRADKLKT